MQNLSFETVKKMKSVGFSYPDYDHFLNKGMVYSHLGDEYVIGGYSLAGFSKEDQCVSENGCWLPDESHLLSWLNANSFSYTVQWSHDDQRYQVQAHDMLCGVNYNSSGLDLVNALAKVIIKICKSKMRDYVPSTALRLKVIE